MATSQNEFDRNNDGYKLVNIVKHHGVAIRVSDESKEMDNHIKHFNIENGTTFYLDDFIGHPMICSSNLKDNSERLTEIYNFGWKLMRYLNSVGFIVMINGAKNSFPPKHHELSWEELERIDIYNIVFEYDSYMFDNVVYNSYLEMEENDCKSEEGKLFVRYLKNKSNQDILDDIIDRLWTPKFTKTVNSLKEYNNLPKLYHKDGMIPIEEDYKHIKELLSDEYKNRHFKSPLSYSTKYGQLFYKNIISRILKNQPMILPLIDPVPITKETEVSFDDDKEDEPTMCCICESNPVKTLVLPCMHAVVCRNCSNQLKSTLNAHKCIICRQEITDIIEE